MITDLDARGLQIVLFDPSGERVFGGKFMESVRNMPGHPTEEEKEQEALEDALIDEINEQFGVIYSVGFQKTYVPDTRLRAIFRALVEFEGEGAVMETLKSEGLA